MWPASQDRLILKVKKWQNWFNLAQLINFKNEEMYLFAEKQRRKTWPQWYS